MNSQLAKPIPNIGVQTHTYTLTLKLFPFRGEVNLTTSNNSSETPRKHLNFTKYQSEALIPISLKDQVV